MQVKVAGFRETVPNGAFANRNWLDPRGFGGQSAIEMPPRTV